MRETHTTLEPKARAGDGPGERDGSHAPRLVRIFISSPGDVAEERALARRVIERLDAEFGPRAVLQPIFWEHEPLRATGAWHEQLVSPSEADIVICILWSRLGTRQPAEITRPDGSRYDSGTEYEFEEAWRSFQERGHPDLLVYRKTVEPRVSLRDRGELMGLLEQKEALDRFIDTWFQDREEGTLIAAFHPFESASVFEELLEIHIRRLLEERLPDAPAGRGPRSRAWTAGSPFRGLKSFEFDHAPVFYGRTKATSEVLDALRERAALGRPFLLVLGMSGCGKSSLVRAGVLPLLTQPRVIEGVGSWRRALMRPSDAAGDPFSGLARALLREHALAELAADGTGVDELAGLLRESPQAAVPLLADGLSRAAAEMARAEGLARQPEARLALVVDQLEELFTTGISASARRRFVAALGALVASGRVWVLATLRSDFYPRLTELPSLVELKEAGGQYDLLPPTASEIGRMIRQPARLAGLRFEERESTGERLDDLLTDAAAANPEALPLLQFTLEELYAARGDGEVLGFAAYEDLGGVGGALAQRAEATFDGLSLAEQKALPEVLSRLVAVGAEAASGATRRWARLASFADGGAERSAVDRFVAARLCVTDRDESGEAVVSVAHEALLEHWPRLARWLEHNRDLLRIRDRLGAAALQWEEVGRPSSHLLASAKRLAEAQELEQAAGIDLSNAERDYLQASLARGRRTRWLKRGAVAALAVLAVLAAIGAWMANQRRQEAELARGESEAVTGFLGDMLASVDPEELGREVMVRDVLERAAGEIDDLDEQPLIQARLLSTMGSVYRGLGLYDEARALMERGLAIREAGLAPTDPAVARSLHDLGELLRIQGDYEAARPLLERALATRQESYGPEHPVVAESLNALGALTAYEGDAEAATSLYEQAIAVWEETLGPSDPQLAHGLHNLAITLSTMADYAAARPLFERALAIYEAELGPRHPKFASTLASLASVSSALGDHQATKELDQRVLALREEAYGPEHPEVAKALNNLAYDLEALGDFDAARRLYERALAMGERLLGPEHPELASSLRNLAVVIAKQGSPRQAEPLLRRALAITEQALGPEHGLVGGTLGNLAAIVGDLGRPEEAIRLRERSIAIYEKALAPDHPATATGLLHLAELKTEAGEYAEARALGERALRIREEKLGSKHPDVALNLRTLAVVHTREGDYGQAMSLFERAVAIQQAGLPVDHPDVASVQADYAKLLHLAGDLERAEESFRSSLAIREEKLGADHPLVAETLEGYAALLRELDRSAEADELAARARVVRGEGSRPHR